MNTNDLIQELLAREHTLEAELSQLIYGAPEVRDDRHLYIHYRESGRQVTRYAGIYTEELHNLILNNNRRAKDIKKALKETRHQLSELGYIRRELPDYIKRNLDFAKRNLSLTIHSQAILEGVATTFAETDTIIEGGRVHGMTERDIRKIINMKHAWEFIMDEDVITSPDNLALLMQINKIVEESFYFNAGKLRDVPVSIGGTTWRPELPIESQITETLTSIITSASSDVEKTINLLLFIMRSQIFIDGNKRTAVIFANHFLIKQGLGLIYIPAEKTDDFKKLLVDFYETGAATKITKFLKKDCLIKI